MIVWDSSTFPATFKLHKKFALGLNFSNLKSVIWRQLWIVQCSEDNLPVVIFQQRQLSTASLLVTTIIPCSFLVKTILLVVLSYHCPPKHGISQRYNHGEIFVATSAMVGQNLPSHVGIGLLRYLKLVAPAVTLLCQIYWSVLMSRFCCLNLSNAHVNALTHLLYNLHQRLTYLHSSLSSHYLQLAYYTSSY